MFRFKTLAAGLGLALIGAVASFAPVGQPQQALAADPEFAAGLNTAAGRIRHAGVAEAFADLPAQLD